MVRLLILVISLGLSWATPHRAYAAGANSWKIVAATYPIYLLTRSVIAGDNSVSLSLLLPAGLGCPHDYSLMPEDVRRLAAADLLVVNGMGLEEFLGAPVERVRPHLPIIDASTGVKDKLSYTDSEEHEKTESGLNPHYFASPRMAAVVVVHIATELSKLRPESRNRFMGNAAQAAKRLNALADELANAVKTFRNRRIATQHGAFDYLARDTGLEIVATVQAHPGQDLSAAQMRELVARLKQTKAGAIFAEPQYPDKLVRTIAREARVPAATLDSAASGPDGAGFDYYETVMRANLQALEKTLGAR